MEKQRREKQQRSFIVLSLLRGYIQNIFQAGIKHRQKMYIEIQVIFNIFSLVKIKT